MTGYLTQRGEPNGDRYNLVVPNREIRNIITNHILKMFKEGIKEDGETVGEFCDALLKQNPEKVESIFTDYMKKTISIRDTFVKKPTKENFYHGILLGLLGHMGNWLVKSNEESGEGYSDILIEVPESRTGIVIEMKYAEEGRLEYACRAALQQIEGRKYAARLISDGMTSIVKYGIACYKKHCRVLKGEE